MKCYRCGWYLSYDYIDQHGLRTCDDNYVMCPNCLNEIEKEENKNG